VVIQKQNCEKEQASRGIMVSYETRPEVYLDSPIAPLPEILQQAVIDATASHMFISANALPGHILCIHIYQRTGDVYMVLQI
jgi:hypothetical protein